MPINSGKLKRAFVRAGLPAVIVLLCVSFALAQSTNLDFPTPVSTDQIAGRIRARDIGDSRLTSHYYIFETGTGDVVLNIETANLNGDIDIYTAGSMRPLLKASVYAVGYATVMQRQIYLRIPSRLILRVEGRTPGDDPASYAIKFAGVFKPVAASSVRRNPGDPRVSGTEAGEGAVARVNSAGTIIEEIKQPPPVVPVAPPPVKKTPGETAAKTTGKTKNAAPPADPKAKSSGSTAKAKSTAPPAEREKPKTDSATAKNSSGSKKTPENKPEKKAGADPKPKADSKPKSTPKSAAGVTKAAKNVSDPLAKVELVVDMKDGRKLKYAMTDVLRVGVDRGVVTIMLKNGDIERLSLLDIEEMKIGQ